MKCEMTTEASPSPTTTTATTIVKIKKENQGDEIKEFAETAMNELLGWYGYDGVDRLDLQSKTSCLASFNSDNSSRSEIHSNSNGNNRRNHDNIVLSTLNHDSSRENSKSPCSIKRNDKQDTFCGWCRREVPENSPDFLTTTDGPRYCSESCFAQSRRASFKRAKTCDWCRHVRHAVSYVDFQDGASQLQFCSDKCLNQYKMQIFCKETQAHLDMNPHLKEKGLDNSSGLITPELWLKNCRSRSISPVSELSRSPTPPSKHQQTTQAISHQQQQQQHHQQQGSHKPVISVTPVSKLMSKNASLLNMRHLTKHNRRRKSSRIAATQNNNTNNGNGTLLNLTNSGKDMKSKILADTLKTNTTVPKSAHNFVNVQNLCFNMPPISPVSDSFSGPPSSVSQRPGIPPSLLPNPQNAYHTRLPFAGIPPQTQPPLRLPYTSPPAPVVNASPLELPQPTIFGAPVPPVTVMVPYPIIIPLPIPIPIPLPITDFLKAAAKQKNDTIAENNSTESLDYSNNPELITSAPETSNVNEPLDFTKSKSSPNNEISKKIEDTEPDLSNPDSDTDTHNSDSKFSHSKMKITRLCAKRLIAKESEKSRPLRKRKRIIDYLRNTKDDDDTNRHKK